MPCIDATRKACEESTHVQKRWCGLQYCSYFDVWQIQKINIIRYLYSDSTDVVLHLNRPKYRCCIFSSVMRLE